MQKVELCALLIRSKMIQPLWKFLKKLKTELLYNLAIPLLVIYPKELKGRSQREICTPIFITALFTIAKIWKYPKCPSMDEQRSKMWYIHTMEFRFKKEGNSNTCYNMGEP